MSQYYAEHAAWKRRYVKYLEAKRAEAKKNPTWKTRDGSVIYIKDMTTNHLNAVVAMCSAKSIAVPSGILFELAQR